MCMFNLETKNHFVESKVFLLVKIFRLLIPCSGRQLRISQSCYFLKAIRWWHHHQLHHPVLPFYVNLMFLGVIKSNTNFECHYIYYLCFHRKFLRYGIRFYTGAQSLKNLIYLPFPTAWTTFEENIEK